MSEVLTLAGVLAKTSISREHADEITQALVAIVAAEAKTVEDRMNRDLQAAVDRQSAQFERTVRDQTRWIAIIVFSAIGLVIGSVALGLAVLKLGA